MEATINITAATLADLEMTSDDLQQAAAQALGNLVHPENGDTVYFNDVRVTVIVSELKAG
jgi:hypothetical protein